MIEEPEPSMAFAISEEKHCCSYKRRLSKSSHPARNIEQMGRAFGISTKTGYQLLRKNATCQRKEKPSSSCKKLPA
jgi:hypothetical protein